MTTRVFFVDAIRSPAAKVLRSTVTACPRRAISAAASAMCCPTAAGSGERSPGLVRPGRHHRAAVVRRQLRVAAIELRLIKARLHHAALEIVRHQNARRAAEIFQRPHVRRGPVRHALRERRLGERNTLITGASFTASGRVPRQTNIFLGINILYLSLTQSGVALPVIIHL